MAIKNRCSACDQILSVPDDMAGERVKCPSCGAMNRIVSGEELQRLDQKQKDEEALRKKAEHDRDRLALLDRLAANESPGAAIDLAAVRARTRRLREVADLAIVGAWLALLLALGTGVLCLLAADVPRVFRIALAGGAALAGVLGFAGAQVLGWMAAVVADAGDAVSTTALLLDRSQQQGKKT